MSCSCWHAYTPSRIQSGVRCIVVSAVSYIITILYRSIKDIRYKLKKSYSNFVAAGGGGGVRVADESVIIVIISDTKLWGVNTPYT